MASEQLYSDDVQEGDELPVLRKTFMTRDLAMFAGAAADFYPIHYDGSFAKERGLEGVIVHGALKHALLGRFLHEWIAPAGRITSFSCSYRGIDAPGEELACRGKVTDVSRGNEGSSVVDLEIWIEKADGTITTPGRARVEIPRRR
jgi:acyl dehydratase